jgi:hypothetical protein
METATSTTVSDVIFSRPHTLNDPRHGRSVTKIPNCAIFPRQAPELYSFAFGVHPTPFMRRTHQLICAWLLIVIGVAAIVGSPSIGLSLGSRPQRVDLQSVSSTERAVIVQASVFWVPMYDVSLMSAMMFAGVASMFLGVHWSVVLRR